jgi:hypothetical protein
LASSSGLLCRLEDLKQELGIDSTNHANDLSMEIAIETAGQEISDYCGRDFVRTTGATRYYTAEHSTCLLTDDILAITALRTDDDGNGSFETTWSATAYLLAPFNAAAGVYPAPYTHLLVPSYSSGSFPCISRGVQIVGDFGYATAVPPIVKKACLFQAALSFRAKDAPFGAVGGRDFGQEIQAPMAMGLHPFVARQLNFYRRRVIA